MLLSLLLGGHSAWQQWQCPVCDRATVTQASTHGPRDQTDMGGGWEGKPRWVAALTFTEHLLSL